MEEKTITMLSGIEAAAGRQLTNIAKRIRRARTIAAAEQILVSTQYWVASCQSIRYLIVDARGCPNESGNAFIGVLLGLENYRFLELPKDPYQRRFAKCFNTFLNQAFDLGRHEPLLRKG